MIECPEVFFEDAKLLLGKDNIFPDIEYSFLYSRMDSKRQESKEWLLSALEMEVKSKSSGETTKLVRQLYDAWQEKLDIANRMKGTYAYEESQKEKFNALLRSGKTWLGAIAERNHILLKDSRLRDIKDLQEYFSILQTSSKYVIALSGADECSNYWRKFVEVSKLPLSKELWWRASYAAVVDGGVLKAEQKAKEELDISYQFVIGHPQYSVEYMDGQLTVDCKPLEHCKIKLKSKGFSVELGAGVYRSEIVVDNIDFSMNRTGINIVVIDKENGQVVDSINVNTYSDAGLKINRV